MGIEGLPLARNEEYYRGHHHWQFCEIFCCASALVSGALLPPVDRPVRVRELTIRNTSTRPVVLFMQISGGCVKLSLDVPSQTTRQWSSQDGRRFPSGVFGFYVVPSCTYPSCVYITGAGLEE